MESGRVSCRGKTRGLYDKMTLEDYLLLLQSPSLLHLTVPHLNQIISMHGYKKIHKVHKKLLTDAVSSLTLMEPARSTLKEYISPLVITTLDDVVANLQDLGWEECCVTSIETLSSWNNTHSSSPPLTSPRHLHDVVQHSSKHQQSAPVALKPRAYGVVSSPAKKLAPKRKRKRSPRSGGAHGALDCVSYGSC